MSTPQNLHEELTQTRNYITALEGAILHICEGANLDAAALVEDLQTPARAQEMRKKIAALRKQNAAERKDRKTVYGKGGKVAARVDGTKGKKSVAPARKPKAAAKPKAQRQPKDDRSDIDALDRIFANSGISYYKLPAAR